MNINPLYVLPNLFTAGSIFFGVTSVMLSSNSLFEWAAWFIILSMIFDGLDGRVARLTNTSSKFGVEFDSLADIVAFGVAPAFLLWFYVGMDYGRYGVVVSAMFVIFGAIRLARFNISTANSEPGVFIGLPIPSAAAIVVLWILIDLKYHFLSEFQISWALLILGFVAGILMVSNIRYPSFKKLKWNLKIFVIAVMILAAVYIAPREVFGALMSGYVLWGIARWLFVVFVKILFKKTA